MNIGLRRMDILVSKLVAGAVLATCFLLMGCREAPAQIRIVPPETTPTLLPTMTPAPITVFVSGEVLRPDVYTLVPESRIKQLVEAAGGFTDNANTTLVNLAQPLSDGVHVHIPAAGESAPTPPAGLTTPALPQNLGEVDLGIGGGLVNINTAELEELDTLPGIGPVTGQKILDYRTVNGPFADVAAVMEVSGIGQSKFDQIKELITIGNQ